MAETACNGTYTRTSDGVWVYPWGDPVPGAEDLTLDWLYPDLVVAGQKDGQVVLVPDALVRDNDDLAWVREVATGPTSRYDGERRRGGPPTPGWSDVWPVPIGEWDSRCGEPLGMTAPELVPARLLAIDDVASQAGVAPKTVSSYLATGRMPQPQGWHAGSPWWTAPIISHWLQQRPGRGARTDLGSSG